MDKQDIRIAFVGDSFINGTGDPEYLGWEGRVCEYIQHSNPDIELTSYNLGIRRETSSDILKRFENELYSRLIDGDRFIVVLSFGINDCVEIDGVQRVDFEKSAQNLEIILAVLRQKYDNVLFVMPAPIADEEINSRIQKVIRMYKTVCKNLNINYIDLFNQLKNDSVWQKETSENDGAHPRSKGYEIFAKHVLDNENWTQLWK